MQENAKNAMNVRKKVSSLFRLFLSRRILTFIPDYAYLKLCYWLRMGRKLDLKHPKTFNEKIQWLKLYDRKPIYSQYVDKYEVRKHVEEIVGKEYLIPLLGVWDHFDEIDFDELPNRFVLKCTHDSGGVVICKNKERFDRKWAREKIEKRLAKNYYDSTREWAYKNIKPRIICEELLETKAGDPPNDYKFHCFNGEPKNVMVCTERERENTNYYFYDKEWNPLTLIYSDLNGSKDRSIPKPKRLNELFEIAAILSKGIPFVRVDLYVEKAQIYFGELTLYPQSGHDSEFLLETDRLWGEALKLPL
jgi:hypothetical protein